MEKFITSRIAAGFGLFFLSLTGVILLLFVIDCYVIKPTFEDLEERWALKDGERVMATIASEVDYVDLFTIDWANWDDTYVFAQDQNRQYLESNYPDPSYLSKNSGIDIFAIYNSKGQNLVKGAYHPKFDQPVELDFFSSSKPSIITILEPVIKQGKKVAGLLNTNHGLVALAAWPIFNSKNEGPAMGVLVMGQFFTDTRFNQLSQKLQITFDLIVDDDVQLIKPEKEIFAKLSSSPDNLKREIIEGTLHQFYYDIWGKPTIVLRTLSSGDITAIGYKSRLILNLTLFIIAFILLVSLIISWDRHKVSTKALEQEELKYRTLFESSYDSLLIIDSDTGRFIDCNKAAARLHNLDSRRELVGLRPENLSSTHQPNGVSSKKLAAAYIKKALDQDSAVFEWEHTKSDGTPFVTLVTLSAIGLTNQNYVLAVVRDMTEIKENEAQREKLIHELQDALAQVKTLSGFIPICASCKNIRDDEGYWQQVEGYIRDRSDAEFSHSLCPDCIKEIYPEFINKQGELK